MELKDFLALAHPVLAVAIVFPMLGIVLNMAWQTRQRRQQIASGDNSKIPPIVGWQISNNYLLERQSSKRG